MTHSELVSRAARWLKNSRGCQVILTRANVVTWELPDAIGWKASGASYVIECKASRGDFLRDGLKPHRLHPGLGAGLWRYYLAPANLLLPSEMPPGWGLLDCHCTKIVEKLSPVPCSERSLVTELQLALAFARNPEPLTIPALDAECWADVGL